VFMAGLEEGLFPHSRSSEDDAELEEERRLCYVGMTRARRKLVLSSAARRRWYGEYRACQPSRFIDEVPDELMDRIEPATSFQQGGLYGNRGGFESRPNPYRRPRGPERVREASPTYAYEDEDQSRSSSGQLGPGMRVRHPQFGPGTIVSVEPTGTDTKLVVRFASVGVKRLLANYAKLQVG